ncbi:MAG: Integration host factor subunit beta [bacterium]|nr:Integration host factor subunit beta [bacterium]
MVTQTKKDLVKEVATRTGLDIQTVKDNIQCMFDTMCEGLGKDGNIEVRNFGIFKVKATPSRTARNPKTGETIHVPAKKLIHFKPGQLMKQRINEPQGAEAAVAPPASQVETRIPERPAAAPQPAKREEKPRRPKPVSRDKAQPAIILMSPRPLND